MRRAWFAWNGFNILVLFGVLCGVRALDLLPVGGIVVLTCSFRLCLADFLPYCPLFLSVSRRSAVYQTVLTERAAPFLCRGFLRSLRRSV